MSLSLLALITLPQITLASSHVFLLGFVRICFCCSGFVLDSLFFSFVLTLFIFKALNYMLA